jgi:hypothetical protein
MICSKSMARQFLLTLLLCVFPIASSAAERTVTTKVQSRPGGPIEEVEMPVHEVPVNPPTADANEVELDDDDLVIGIVVAGQAMAYPVRYLSLYEIVNDEVGKTSLTPTW